jgi:heat-inducible transcriptional repressor
LTVRKESLSERERQVLAAVVKNYVETAEPVGSRTLARRARLGVSAATIRNAMSDLEEKGYLFHPHTSAGRVPTDHAYRLFVDTLMGHATLSHKERTAIRESLTTEGSAVHSVLRRAAEVLGVLAQELGMAVAPTLDAARLERLDLVSVSSDRLLLVLTLESGLVRTIFVEVPGTVHPEALVKITVVLNERLAGLTIGEIRRTLPERLRDTAATPEEGGLLDIFVSTGDQIFDLGGGETGVVLGQASVLADQPEFREGDRMRQLIELTERRDLLSDMLKRRANSVGLTVTIGGEHGDQTLANLTIITAPYRAGPLNGVIGVLGPTRMPYQKVVALVEHTSRMVGELLR